MLGFGLQILLQPSELWQMAREVQPTTMVYFEPGEAKDVPIRPELTIGRKYYADQSYHLQHDPTAFGQRLAQDAIASAQTNGIEYWVGPTEPPVASPDDCARLVACEKARSEILNAQGLKAVVFYLSVGWPLENVETHELYTGQFDAFLRHLPPQNLIGLNEYYHPTGPLHPDSYDPDRPSRIWRFKHWPGIDRHKIVITECGMDIGGNQKTDGWKKQCPVGMSLESWFDTYVQWMGEYLNLISQDDRVIGANWFCGGPGYGWGDYDVLKHWRQAKVLLSGPVPDIPPTEPGLPPGPTIRVRLADGGVVVLPVEEYLRGVVPAEMPASWPVEALKAQAVAARSYAMVAMEDPRHGPEADICSSSHCQNYNPERIHDRSDEAIRVTKGQIIMHQGKLANAYYSANCGGHTVGNEIGFGGAPLPHLRPVDCINPGPKNGHRVGMCQWGAHDMAEAGDGYVTILKHYYTGIEIREGRLP